ncbi:hypothetical protein ACPPVU_13290 [Mucilaginibacter sp. McL0603]|uniref:hypothetical protein n=1 Tax=Mucilaginibacter sp. McL0603 TaxID=3415670 RepID=UPI003CF61BFC
MSSLERAISLREQRRKEQKPQERAIKDLRVYYTGLPEKALYPFDYRYVEIFLNILRKKGLVCPSYHHLYILVAKTIDECLMHSIPYENWYVYGLSVINYDEYLNQSELQKEQTVFNIIVSGLKDIAEIDKLDMSTIEAVTKEIKLKGLDTELEHLTIDDKKYKVTITYYSKSKEEGNPVYLNLLEKSTGKSSRKQIGNTTQDQLYYWISKININNNHIKIKARNSSVRADLYLQDKPRNMEFSIKDLINE